MISSLLRAAVAWALTGAALALLVALASLRDGSLVPSAADRRAFAVGAALVLALAFALCGLVATAAAAVGRRGDRGELGFGAHALAALAGFGAFAAAQLAASATVKWREPDDPTVLGVAVAAGWLVAVVVLRALPSRARRARWPAVAPLGFVLAAGALALQGDRPGPAAAELDPSTAFERTAQRRVVVFGVDGADWRRIRPLVEAGRLPAFERLLDEGRTAPLPTLLPTWTPILWTTAATGVGELEHGVRDFTEIALPGMVCGLQRHERRGAFHPELPRGTGLLPAVRALTAAGLAPEVPVSSLHRRAPAFWNLLSQRGLPVAVVRWYATWPVEPIAGWAVSDADVGLTLHEAGSAESLYGLDLVHPPGLLEELVELVPPYWSLDGPERRGEREALSSHPLLAGLEEVGPLLDARWGALADLVDECQEDLFAANVGLHLWTEERPEVLAVYLAGPDRVSHRTLPLPSIAQEVVDRAYELTDRALGRYLDALDDDTTLIVLSDHGWNYDGDEPGHESGPAGILALWGAGVAGSGPIEGPVSLLDVAPTVLALVGLPVAEHMSGRVISAALDADVEVRRASYGPWDRLSGGQSVRSSRGRGTAVEKLRELGYVE